jgi:ABC-2 type transport system ATP-binding protein
VLAGLARATSGRVTVMGHDVVADYAAARKRWASCRRNWSSTPSSACARRCASRAATSACAQRRLDRRLLAELGLADKAGANMRQLSGGMKRRVLVAQALVHRPPVIVLDEPTAGVDVELRQTLWQFIARLNREGHTVLLTTHYLEEAEALCGRIAMLKQGRVVALDKTSALLAGMASTMLRFKTDDALPPRWPPGARHRPHRAGEGARRRRGRGLLAALRQAGVKVEDLEIGRADLEDVFLEIMGAGRGHDVSPAPAPCSTRRCCASGRWPSRPWPRRC